MITLIFSWLDFFVIMSLSRYKYKYFISVYVHKTSDRFPRALKTLQCMYIVQIIIVRVITMYDMMMITGSPPVSSAHISNIVMLIIL
jgi:hypothetical protein